MNLNQSQGAWQVTLRSTIDKTEILWEDLISLVHVWRRADSGVRFGNRNQERATGIHTCNNGGMHGGVRALE
ncbi:MAG: hypothetical protein ACE5D7_06715 [Fidelibacterota bacterium]